MSEETQHHLVCPRCYGFDHDISDCNKSSTYKGCKHCGKQVHPGIQCYYWGNNHRCRLCNQFQLKRPFKHSIVTCPYVSNKADVESRSKKPVSSSSNACPSSKSKSNNHACPECNKSDGLKEGEKCMHCRKNFHLSCLTKHYCSEKPTLQEESTGNEEAAEEEEEETEEAAEAKEEEEEASNNNNKRWLISADKKKVRLSSIKQTKKAPRDPDYRCFKCKGISKSGWCFCPYCNERCHPKCFNEHCDNCPKDKQKKLPATAQACVYCHDNGELRDPRFPQGWDFCSKCYQKCHNACLVVHEGECSSNQEQMDTEEERPTEEQKFGEGLEKKEGHTTTSTTPIVVAAAPVEQNEDPSLVWAKKELDAQIKGCVAVKEGRELAIGRYVQSSGQYPYLAAVMLAGQSECYYLSEDRKKSMIITTDNKLNFMARMEKVTIAYENPITRVWAEREDYPEDGEALIEELTDATASWFGLRLIVIDELNNTQHNLLDKLCRKRGVPPNEKIKQSVFIKKDKDGYHALIVDLYMVQKIYDTSPRRTLSGKSLPPTAEKALPASFEEEEEKEIAPMDTENKYQETPVILDLEETMSDLELLSDKKDRIRAALTRAESEEDLANILKCFSASLVSDLWNIKQRNFTQVWWKENFVRIRDQMNQGFLVEARKQVASSFIQNSLPPNNKPPSIISVETPSSNNKKRPSPTPIEATSPPKRQDVKQSAAPSKPIQMLRSAPIMGSLDQAPPSSSSNTSSEHPSIFELSQEDHQMEEPSNEVEMEEEPANKDYSGMLSQPNDALAQFDTKSTLEVPEVEVHDPNNNNNESLTEEVLDDHSWDLGADFKQYKDAVHQDINNFLLETNSLLIGTNSVMGCIKEGESDPSGFHLRSYHPGFDTQSFCEPSPQNNSNNNNQSTDPYKEYAKNNKNLHDQLEAAKTKGLTGVGQEKQLDGSYWLILPHFKILVPNDWSEEKKDKFSEALVWIKLISEYLFGRAVGLSVYINMITWLDQLKVKDHKRFEETLEGMRKEFPDRNKRLLLFAKIIPADLFFDLLEDQSKNILNITTTVPIHS